MAPVSSLRKAFARVTNVRSQDQLNVLVLQPSSSVRVIHNDDGATLLDIDQGLCFSLNPTGFRIWELLADGSPLDDISMTLAEDFQMPRSQIFQDVTDLVDALKRAGLLRVPQVGKKRSLWNWISPRIIS
jgi:hypothetical protein